MSTTGGLPFWMSGRSARSRIRNSPADGEACEDNGQVCLDSDPTARTLNLYARPELHSKDGVVDMDTVEYHGW